MKTCSEPRCNARVQDHDKCSRHRPKLPQKHHTPMTEEQKARYKLNRIRRQVRPGWETL